MAQGPLCMGTTPGKSKFGNRSYKLEYAHLDERAECRPPSTAVPGERGRRCPLHVHDRLGVSQALQWHAQLLPSASPRMLTSLDMPRTAQDACIAQDGRLQVHFCSKYSTLLYLQSACIAQHESYFGSDHACQVAASAVSTQHTADSTPLCMRATVAAPLVGALVTALYSSRCRLIQPNLTSSAHKLSTQQSIPFCMGAAVAAPLVRTLLTTLVLAALLARLALCTLVWGSHMRLLWLTTPPVMPLTPVHACSTQCCKLAPRTIWGSACMTTDCSNMVV